MRGERSGRSACNCLDGHSTIYYTIRVRGHLASHWADWFAPLMIRNEPQGEAVLVGYLPDQAALYGVLGRIRDSGLPLLSVASGPAEPPLAAEPH